MKTIKTIGLTILSLTCLVSMHMPAAEAGMNWFKVLDNVADVITAMPKSPTSNSNHVSKGRNSATNNGIILPNGLYHEVTGFKEKNGIFWKDVYRYSIKVDSPTIIKVNGVAHDSKWVHKVTNSDGVQLVNHSFDRDQGSEYDFIAEAGYYDVTLNVNVGTYSSHRFKVSEESIPVNVSGNIGRYSNAAQMYFGGKAVNYIPASGEINERQYYRFTLGAPTTVNINLRSLFAKEGVNVKLTDENENVIYNLYSRSNPENYRKALPAGNYFLIAYKQARKGCAYELKIW